MSKGPHIVSVELPDVSASALIALESEGLAQAVSAAGELLDVLVTFGDGSQYRYPRVPASLALAVKSDPEGAFPNIKFWPGYHRIV